MNAAEVAERLQKHRKSGASWVACCPAHDDRMPSLSISDGDNGVLVKCHAGCSQAAVLDALANQGIEIRKQKTNGNGHDYESIPFNLGILAAAKKLPEEFLTANKLIDEPGRVAFQYIDADGSLFRTKYRRALQGERRFYSAPGEGYIPYGLWHLDSMLANDGRLILCEGETDTLTLWKHGFTALGIPGATNWKEDWARFLPADGPIYVAVDGDEAGKKFEEAFRKSKLAPRVSFIRFGLDAKDPNALHCQGPEEFVERFEARLAAAVPAIEAQPPPITAKRFVWRDPKTIPPRPWLFGKHYMRGMASATAGIGGAGKSTMLLTEAIGASIGRNLITGDPIPVGPLNVWLHNGEDPPDELERRVAAIILYHSIDPEMVEQRLHVTSGREMPILVAEALSDGGKLFVPREDGVQLRDELVAKKIDIFMADPFVTIHRVNENDNGLIDSVMGLIRNIAHQANCAFEVAHHLRKLNGGDVGIDDIRGAGSIVGACRSVRLMAAMTTEEANRYGIEEKDRKAFSWLVNGKANMLPPGHAREWVRSVGVSLDNAADPYEADNIGVLERWLPPESYLDLTPAEYHSIRRTLQEAKQDELRYNAQASGWAGKIIAKVLGKDPSDKGVKSEMYGLIERWKKSGKLKVESVHLARQGRNIEIVKWSDLDVAAE